MDLANIKLPPRNVQMEKALLSTIFLSPDLLVDYKDLGLTAKDFVERLHQRIFVSVDKLYLENKTIDVVTVSDDLGEEYFDYIIEVSMDQLTCSGGLDYCRRLRDLTVRRDVIDQCRILTALCYDNEDAKEILEKARNLAMINVGEEQKAQTFLEVYAETYESLFMKEHLIGTGYSSLDLSLTGYSEGQLIVVGARPGVGKSTFMLNSALRHADDKKRVAFLSLEMSKKELTKRVLSLKTGIPLWVINNSDRRTEKQSETILNFGDYAESVNLQLMDNVYTIDQIEAFVKKQSVFGLDILYVDYLQIVKGPDNWKESRQQFIGKVTRTLKMLALKYGIPIITGAQVRRGTDEVAPKLSDLRESGDIEQDADVVMFLSREEEMDVGCTRETMIITISKHRNGPTGEASLKFVKNTMRLEDFEQVN